MDRLVRLSLSDDKILNDLGYCFTSKLRRNLISAISSNSYTIMELAKKFNVPLSTMSTNIKILNDAGIIRLSPNVKKRGNEKVVSMSTTFLQIDLSNNPKQTFKRKIFEIPIGSYSDFKVEKPCGIANEVGLVLEDDKPDVFYSPSRVSAQIIWFTAGYLEYELPLYMFKNHTLQGIEFSLELCSECPNFKNDWESEITFAINGKKIGNYLSPGDFGGRQGKLTPNYWSKTATQFGLLKSVKITDEGTFIDQKRVSAISLAKLDVLSNPTLKLKISVENDAKPCGGINIFGEKFGDYPQNITALIEYI